MHHRKLMLVILLACLVAGSALVVNAASQSPPVLQICTEGTTKVVGTCSYQCAGNQWIQADSCQAIPAEVQIEQVTLPWIDKTDLSNKGEVVENGFTRDFMTGLNPGPRTVTIYGGSLSGGIAFSALDENGNVLAVGGAPISGMIKLYIPPAGGMTIYLPYDGPPITRTGVYHMSFWVTAPKPALGPKGSYTTAGGANFIYSFSPPL